MREIDNYYNRSRSEVASIVPVYIKTILDVGCGQGSFLHLIKQKTGAETWGIELVHEVAEIAKRNADKIIVGKIEDAIHLLPDSYFNCITFNDVLEHLVEPQKVLQLIRQKLLPDGVIIASIPNVRYFFNLYELLIKKDWKYEEAGILDSTHLRFFTQKSMKRMFKQAGYKIIKVKGINKITSRKFLALNILTLWIYNDTKYMQFICIAQKTH